MGEIHGKLSAEARGGDISWDSLFSLVRLKLSLEDCTIAGLPIQKALATSLFLPSIATLDFSSISATAEMKTGDTIRTTFKGVGDQLDFSSEGWVMLNGRLQQQFNGVFSGKMAASFPDVVKNSLIPAGKGKRKLTCRLFGTYYEPRFELDQATLRRAVGNMFDGLRQEIIDIHNGR